MRSMVSFHPFSRAILGKTDLRLASSPGTTRVTVQEEIGLCTRGTNSTSTASPAPATAWKAKGREDEIE